MNSTYNKFFKSSKEDIVNKFMETAMTTNRDFHFLVNWKKVEKQIKKYKLELSLFDTLIKSNDFEEELKQILKKYPQAIKAVPVLLALSDKDSNLVLVKNFAQWDFNEFSFNFNKFIPETC
jgi:type II restriction enzyme